METHALLTTLVGPHTPEIHDASTLHPLNEIGVSVKLRLPSHYASDHLDGLFDATFYVSPQKAPVFALPVPSLMEK